MTDDCELCRLRGWVAGTRLVGDEGYGPTVIEIRYVGENVLVAKEISQNGKPSPNATEHAWTLFCRAWKRVEGPTQVAETGEIE